MFFSVCIHTHRSLKLLFKRSNHTTIEVVQTKKVLKHWPFPECFCQRYPATTICWSLEPTELDLMKPVLTLRMQGKRWHGNILSSFQITKCFNCEFYLSFAGLTAAPMGQRSQLTLQTLKGCSQESRTHWKSQFLKPRSKKLHLDKAAFKIIPFLNKYTCPLKTM